MNGNLRNIILVEVKRENHILNEKDKEQAINYARLLDEIAPYCVVTNGRTTKIFDTLTKEELTSSDLSKSDFVTAGYNLTLPEDIREIALRAFIGLDRTNLLRFCQLQSERNFQDIKSEEISSSRSIIDELHCSRVKYMDEYEKFMKSGSKIYAIIGNSRYGKTNYLYSIWQQYRDHIPILFYNAGLLTQRIITSIQEDFHFLLDKEYSLAELVRRFDDITKNNGDQRFFIVIDGLDEHPNTIELRNELNDLIKKVQDTNIHLIISCKTTTDESNDIWNSLTHFKGSLNSFGENIYLSRDLSYQKKRGFM
ncbi:type I restriction enzyme HsdR N-terminal domain-containing protein [Paenibacillus amylolyticus]|nr:type I restriction enzyme HsdR N-terminal domain-containing protein [Paenibacillus amylolyticus]